MREDHLDGAGVGDGDDVLRIGGDHLVHPRHRPLPQHRGALAARGGQAERVGEPGRPPGVQLVLCLGLALELPEAELLQPGVVADLVAGERDGRRLGGAFQRTGVHLGVWLQPRDVVPQPPRLGAALLVELGVR